MDYHGLPTTIDGVPSIPTGYIEHPSLNRLGIESHRSLIFVEGRIWDFDSAIKDEVPRQENKQHKCCCNYVVVDMELQKIPFFSRMEGGRTC